jgi:hypothetical protein
VSDPRNPRVADAWAGALAELVPEEQQLFRRFLRVWSAVVAANALHVVKVERLEVVDRHGRTRVVIGALGGVDARTMGVGVYDRANRERITLALGDGGPVLGFALDGDGALVLGVDDFDTAVTSPGPYVEALAPDGTVAVGWRVDGENGEVDLKGLGPRRSLPDV